MTDSLLTDILLIFSATLLLDWLVFAVVVLVYAFKEAVRRDDHE